MQQEDQSELNVSCRQGRLPPTASRLFSLYKLSYLIYACRLQSSHDAQPEVISSLNQKLLANVLDAPDATLKHKTTAFE